ncbi:glycosyl transferase family 1 [Sulfuriferula plumbiphila]|uniref:Glycosyl transferase family 1 n=1 Tax=Sulfuriferula plumbiphila TaxID=171865 RepID=A0A512L6D4_9PROT|nr:glycosyltransferase family 4 protein [Sulfuriferula plumbiphila]BBP03611.1 glycosyl transferase family 1 [Sulfuriferula plumbiphila]GEP30012.1 glycosyl transferase family 1 [Sulfuriferula plumbiphila]
MPIKVVHVVRQYHPSVGGMEDVVQNIAHQQRVRHGQLPKIITLDRLFRNSAERLAADELVNNIPVMRLPYRGSSRYPLCPSVLEHVQDADVIHVHGIDFFFDYLAATWPIHRRPMVVSTHGGFFHTGFASAFKKIYFDTVTRVSSRAYARVIATSDNDGEIFSGIVKPPKMVVIENGVNVEKYSAKSAPNLMPALIYFGRWSENKGLLETIAFFRHLVSQQPGWKLIIAGREYDHSQEELMALLQKHELSGCVRLAPNPSDQELASLIGQSSYFICLSRHEGFGIAPIEAMSAGLTPVLSDIPPFRNLIEQSGLGVLLGEGSPADRTAALLALHHQGERGYANRRMLAQAFVDRYNWQHIADKYVDIYSILANQALRRSTCV